MKYNYYEGKYKQSTIMKLIIRRAIMNKTKILKYDKTWGEKALYHLLRLENSHYKQVKKDNKILLSRLKLNKHEEYIISTSLIFTSAFDIKVFTDPPLAQLTIEEQKLQVRSYITQIALFKLFDFIFLLMSKINILNIKYGLPLIEDYQCLFDIYDIQPFRPILSNINIKIDIDEASSLFKMLNITDDDCEINNYNNIFIFKNNETIKKLFMKIGYLIFEWVHFIESVGEYENNRFRYRNI